MRIVKKYLIYLMSIKPKGDSAMVKYKNSYCMSFVVFSIYMSIVLLVCAIPFSIILTIVTEYSFFQVIGVSFLSVLSLILFSTIFTLLINLFINIFTKHKVYLSDSKIIFENKTFELMQIQYATIYLPNFSRTNSTPLELVLWTYDKQQMIIKRPNILMIFKLKKLCINSKFGINELLKEIKFFVLIGVFTGLFLLLVLLFS